MAGEPEFTGEVEVRRVDLPQLFVETVVPVVRGADTLAVDEVDRVGFENVELGDRLGLAGEQRRVETALPPGRWRMRVRGEGQHSELDVVDDAAGAVARELTWNDGRPAPSAPVGPEPVLLLNNTSQVPQTFIGNASFREVKFLELEKVGEVFHSGIGNARLGQPQFLQLLRSRQPGQPRAGQRRESGIELSKAM